MELNSSCDIANGNFIIVKNFGSKNGQLIDHSIYYPGHKEFTRGMVLGPFFMFRKTLIEKSGLFDEQEEPDWELDDYQLQRLKELGLADQEPEEDDFISRL